jgi:hypothetical protein
MKLKLSAFEFERNQTLQHLSNVGKSRADGLQRRASRATLHRQSAICLKQAREGLQTLARTGFCDLHRVQIETDLHTGRRHLPVEENGAVDVVRVIDQIDNPARQHNRIAPKNVSAELVMHS